MKRFIDWLKSISKQQSAANEAEQAPVRVRVKSESEGEYSDDSSFSCAWAEQTDSSIFDTGSLNIEKSEDENAESHNTLTLEGDSLCSAEEDIGIDPYNSGRFDTKNQ